MTQSVINEPAVCFLLTKMSFIFVFLCFLHIFVIILMICTDPYTRSVVEKGTEYMAVLVDDSLVGSLHLPKTTAGTPTAEAMEHTENFTTQIFNS